MPRTFLPSLKWFCAATLMATPCAALAASSGDLASPEAKTGYVLGVEAANSVARLQASYSREGALQGFKDRLDGKPLLMTEAEMTTVKQQINQTVQKKQQETQMKSAQDNKAAGEAFLAANKGKPGVTTTASGLQYKVIKKGDGPKPKATDTVEVHYRGTLINGQEFDSSYKRGQTISFPLNGVIPGWTEGVQLMPTGSKYEFVIPSALAYGERGAGRDIGPNSTLIFEVELVGIKK